MRDLAARLRAIVNDGRLADPAARESRAPASFVADGVTGTLDLDAIAAAVGGARVDSANSACIVIDRVLDADRWHGRGRVESYAVDGAAPIGLFDGRVGGSDEWASRVVFFDIETTGLSGGAGTLAFLAGCGWFEEGAFRVRQFLLSGPSGEPAMLDALAGVFDEASLLVTFNGRSFDVPFMDMRWAYHRRESAASDLPHFDMLPPARRLWKRLGGATRESGGEPFLDDAGRRCTLSSLERSVLRFHRVADVPGFEIPARYFQFLRTGNPAFVEGVLRHNRHDLISLAAIMSHALRLASEGPDVCETSTEQVALGRLYERAGDSARAAQAYGLASSSDDREAAAHALARLAVLLRRENRYDEAAAAWQGVLALSSEGRRPFTALERRAAEALAIHHEHRAHNPGTAKQYAETLRAQASGRLASDVDHRLGRLDRKIKAAENGKGGTEAARLID